MFKHIIDYYHDYVHMKMMMIIIMWWKIVIIIISSSSSSSSSIVNFELPGPSLVAWLKKYVEVKSWNKKTN